MKRAYASVGLPSCRHMKSVSSWEASMRWAVQGGESVALARLADQLSDKGWVAAFEKPKGDPSAFIKPATTVLSPHLKFGTLSCRLFFVRLQQVRGRALKRHTWRPCSLLTA